MAEQKNTRTIVLAVILVIALAGAGAYVMMSRGGPESAPSQPSVKPALDAKSATKDAPEDTAAAKAGEAMAPAENAPLTLAALQYLPESAQLALGVPAVNSLLATVAPFVQELFQKDLNVAEELGLIAQDLAKDMGVEESDDLSVVLTAIGLDTTKGAALFADFEELAEAAFEAASSGTPLDDPAAMMSKANAIAVIPVIDGEKVVASLKKLTDDMLSGIAVSEETVGDITIVSYEGIGAYCLTDTVLILGNDLDLLKEAAAHEGAPVALQYGSASCPPDDIHEAAMLIHGEKFVPLIEKFTSLLEELDPVSYLMVQSQMENMRKMYETSSGDPLLITLSLRDDAIELKSKIDSESYPLLLESMGTAKPLHWAQLLPQNTLAFLSLAITPEAKQQIKDVYLQNLPDEIKNSPGFAQAMQFGQPALDMLGQEITLGVTGMDPIDFPSVFLFVELSNVMQANILLPMVPQLPEGDPYNDVQIKAINFPSPIQFYFALVDDALLLSNSVVGMQEIIDLQKGQKTSGFFEALEPPIDPETPIYQALLLKPELYKDMVEPLAGLSGQNIPAEFGGVFETIGDLFTDIRFFAEMQDNWMITRISIVRTPLN